MKDRLQLRLEDLRSEYEKGKATIEELEAKLYSVRSTMLRISGAIQVLEEELGHSGQAPEVPMGAKEPGALTRGSHAAEPVDGKAPDTSTLQVRV